MRYRNSVILTLLLFCVTAHAHGMTDVAIAGSFFLGLGFLVTSVIGLLLNLAFKTSGLIGAMNRALGISMGIGLVVGALCGLLSSWWHHSVSLNDDLVEIIARFAVLLTWMGISVWSIRRSLRKSRRARTLGN